MPSKHLALDGDGVKADSFPLFLKSLPLCTALVHRDHLYEVIGTLMAKRERMAGREPSEGKGARLTAPALLGLKVETLLRLMARKSHPFARSAFLCSALNVERTALVRALAWLSERGTVRAEGDRGRWSIPLPATVEEALKDYVPVPESAIFDLSAKDFALLALMHHWAEMQNEKNATRKKIIPLLDNVLIDKMGKEAVGEKTLRHALQRLQALDFLQSAGPGRVKLRPDLAQQRAMRARGTANLFDLFATPEKLHAAA